MGCGSSAPAAEDHSADEIKQDMARLRSTDLAAKQEALRNILLWSEDIDHSDLCTSPELGLVKTCVEVVGESLAQAAQEGSKDSLGVAMILLDALYNLTIAAEAKEHFATHDTGLLLMLQRACLRGSASTDITEKALSVLGNLVLLGGCRDKMMETGMFPELTMLLGKLSAEVRDDSIDKDTKAKIRSAQLTALKIIKNMAQNDGFRDLMASTITSFDEADKNPDLFSILNTIVRVDFEIPEARHAAIEILLLLSRCKDAKLINGMSASTRLLATFKCVPSTDNYCHGKAKKMVHKLGHSDTCTCPLCNVLNSVVTEADAAAAAQVKHAASSSTTSQTSSAAATAAPAVSTSDVVTEMAGAHKAPEAITGILVKQGHVNVFSWEKRKFVLSMGTLKCFVPETNEAKMAIDSLKDYILDYSSPDHLSVTHPGKKGLTLRFTGTDEDINKWNRLLKEHIDYANSTTR